MAAGNAAPVESFSVYTQRKICLRAVEGKEKKKSRVSQFLHVHAYDEGSCCFMDLANLALFVVVDDVLFFFLMPLSLWWAFKLGICCCEMLSAKGPKWIALLSWTMRSYTENFMMKWSRIKLQTLSIGTMLNLTKKLCLTIRYSEPLLL